MIPKFERAVTDDQKQVRKDEIKKVFEEQFSKAPLSQISLTSISKGLEWGRSNIYKYYGSVDEILADVWADKFTALCNDFNTNLKGMVECTPEMYAELAYQMYFGRDDVLRYISLQPTIAANPNTLPILRDVRPLYKRWISEHLDLLQLKFGLNRGQAENVYIEEYYIAIGLFNTENFEMKLSPEIADMYPRYVHWRFISAISLLVRNAIVYSEHPETDPRTMLDRKLLEELSDFRRGGSSSD